MQAGCSAHPVSHIFRLLTSVLSLLTSVICPLNSLSRGDFSTMLNNLKEVLLSLSISSLRAVVDFSACWAFGLSLSHLTSIFMFFGSPWSSASSAATATFSAFSAFSALSTLLVSASATSVSTEPASSGVLVSPGVEVMRVSLLVLDDREALLVLVVLSELIVVLAAAVPPSAASSPPGATLLLRC
jgi:hypothetical protein